MSEEKDKTQKTIDKATSTYTKVGESQSTVAIGQATLALIERGRPVTVDSLIAYLQQQITPNSHLLVQAQHTAAEKALREAETKSHSQSR